MKLALILFALILVGCGRQPHTKILHIAPEALPFVESFQAAAMYERSPAVIDDLEVVFTSRFDGTFTIGQCRWHTDTTPKVTLSWSYWLIVTDATREQLVFHELGHCILHREHVTGYVFDLNRTIPRSIMVPVNFSDGFYLNHRAYYLYELFNGK